MCLAEKMPVLDNLPSAMSYSAFVSEFNVSESTMYIKQGVFKYS